MDKDKQEEIEKIWSDFRWLPISAALCAAYDAGFAAGRAYEVHPLADLLESGATESLPKEANQ